MHDLPDDCEKLFQLGVFLGLFDFLVHVEPTLADADDLFADDVFDVLHPGLVEVLFDVGDVVQLKYSEFIDFPNFVEVKFVEWFIFNDVFAFLSNHNHSFDYFTVNLQCFECKFFEPLVEFLFFAVYLNFTLLGYFLFVFVCVIRHFNIVTEYLFTLLWHIFVKYHFVLCACIILF